MKQLRGGCRWMGTILLSFAFLALAIGQGRAQETNLTAVFGGNILLDGDISDFFDTNGLPLPGVCVKQDLQPPGTIAGAPGNTLGLNESPTAAGATKDGNLHPSGFNQRRIISAYNPFINGGTIFVGVDLPGGTGSAANSAFSNAYGGLVIRGQVVPFDADGNGDPDHIGGSNGTLIARCPADLTSLDVWTCSGLAAGATDDPRNGNGAFDFSAREFYTISLTFSNGAQVTASFDVRSTNAIGQAGLSVVQSSTNTFVVRVSSNTGGTGVPQGFDVEFAIQNVNANVDECSRLMHSLSVDSGSNRDGSGQGEDNNFLTCTYDLPAGISITKVCPPTATVVGGMLAFSGVVSNTGLITVQNIVIVNDQLAPGTPVAVVPVLMPGQTMSFTGSYVVPTNYCLPFITDTLTAVGQSVCLGTNVMATATASCPVTNTPSIVVEKFCPLAPTVVGGLLTFTGFVSNSGNITLTNVMVVNDRPASDTFVFGPVTLFAGQSASFSGSYLIPTNFCGTVIDDTLTATATSICGTNVLDTDTALCAVTNNPSIFVLKICPPNPISLGELLIFSGVVSNSGNVALTNVMVLNNQPAPGTFVFGVPLLLPGTSASFTGSYLVTASNCNDVIVDTLSATATSACGSNVTAFSTASCPVTNNLVVLGPTNQTVCPGQPAFFCVVPVGTAPFTYTWFFGTNVLAGQTNNCLSIPAASLANAGLYCVRVSNPCQTITNCATLSVVTNTTATPLTNQIVCPGSAVTFCTTAGGVGPFSYMWFRNGAMIANATNNCLTLTNVAAADEADYCVKVTGACNAVTNCAWLTVLTNTTAVGPTNFLACPGTDIALCTAAFGTGPFTYAWFRGTNALAGQTNNCLFLTNLTSVVASNYTVIVSGSCNAVTNTATVRVLTNITATGFADRTVCPGSSVTFSTVATGTGPYNFMWFRNGSMIAGGTNSSLTLTNLAPADSGQYCVKVSGFCSSVTNCAQLTVLTNIILVGPTNTTACPGTDLVLCTVPFGTGPFTYQWFRGTNAISGATNNCLVLPGITPADAANYAVVATGFCNSATNTASVSVQTGVAATPLVSQVTCPGSTVVFDTIPSGSGPFTFRWFRNGLLVPGATNNSLTLSNVATLDAGQYCVQVGGFCNTLTNCASLTVLTNTTLVGPTNITTCPGGNVVLCATPFGTGPFSFTWFQGTNLLAGATNNCLVLNNISVLQASNYTVVAQGFCGAATNTATVNVLAATVAAGLTNVISCPGSNVTFCVTPLGTGPFRYSWFMSGLLLVNETNSCLTLTNVSDDDEADYCVEVTGACGVATNCAWLTVETNTVIFGPTNTMVCPGTDLSLCTAAFGSGPFTYMWLRGTNVLVGETNNCLFLTNVTSAVATNYTVIVTGACNSATNTATVTVVTNIAATTFADRTVCPGVNVTFTTVASGTGPFNFMWFRNGSMINNATNNALILTNVTPADSGQYCVKVGGFCGTITNCAQLNVLTNTTLVGPTNITACPGTDLALCTTAFGTGPFTYLWFQGTNLISGATNNCLLFTNVTAAVASNYTIIVIGACNAATNTATITVATNIAATPFADRTVCPGSSVTFSTTATGSGPFAYSWFRNGSVIAGATNSALTLTNISVAEGGQYCVEVGGFCGSITNCAQLTVLTNTTIVGPTNITACPGTDLALCTTAFGTGPFTYLWFQGTNLISGATNNCLLFTNVSPAATVSYTVVVLGACNAATNTATVTVVTNVAASGFADQTVCPASTVTFATVATGTGPFAFRWFRNGSAIAGVTSNALTLTNVTVADAGQYCVEVNGFCGSVTNCGQLTVLTNTTLVGPTNMTACPGTDLALCTIAFGSGPFTYTWFEGTNVISGATNNCLVLNAITLADANNYTVVVAGACNSVTNTVTVTVTTALAATPLTSRTNCPGGTVVFATVPSGTGPYSFMWLRNGLMIPGATNSSITLTNVTPLISGEYCVKVGGFCGTVTNCAQLSVLTNTTANGPFNTIVCPGTTLNLCSTAFGSGPFTYRWFKGTNTMVAATNSCLVLTNITALDATNYTVVVQGACNAVTNVANLTVLANTVAMPITNQTVCPGSSASFVTTAGGTGPFIYTWLRNGIIITSATNAALTLTNIALTDAGQYCVRVTGFCGTVTNCAQLNVLTNVTAIGPTNNVVCPGGDLALCTFAFGSGPFSYTWLRGTNVIPNATNNCLILTGLSAAQSTNYTVIVRGTCNTVTNTATVTVLTNVTASPLLSQSVCPGTNVTFTTTAGGTGPFSFMWMRNGVMIPGANTGSLTISNASPVDSADYCVKVTGACGSVTNCATLTVLTNLVAIGPFDQTNCPGTDATFCTIAFGAGPFTYTWFRGTNLILGATNNCIVVTNVDVASMTNFSVIVAGACGIATNTATLTVLSNIFASSLTNETVCPGSDVTFTMLAGGAGPFSYTWLRNGSIIPGANGNSLTLSNVTTANAGEYCVYVNGACASITNCARLTVATNTTVFGPLSATNCPGSEVTFCATAFGTGPFTYAWFRGTNAIAGGTNNCLVLPNVTSVEATNYSVVVDGFCGSVTNTATLTIRSNTVATPLTDIAACPGANVAFSTVATGDGPFTYRWFRNGLLIPAASGSTLALGPLLGTEGGVYCVTVAGACNTVTNCATLIIDTNVVAIGPINQTVCPGSSVSLCTVAFGSGPFTYTWLRGSNVLTGVTNNCLVLPSVGPADATNYTVRVQGACSAATNTAFLTVLANVTATPLNNATSCPGASVTFTTVAGGTGPFSYMWFRKGLMINGATNNSLILSNLTTTDSGEYCVKVSGACTTTTNCAFLTVSTNTTVVGPVSSTNCVGNELFLCANAFGTGPFTYTWIKGTNILLGETNYCLALTNLVATDAGTYCVLVNGQCGSVSNCATVTILTNIVATTPTNQTACPGQAVTFCTTATGSGPLTYMWFKDGMQLPGQTNSCVTITNVSARSEGEYCVMVMGACETVARCGRLSVLTNLTAFGPTSQIGCPGEDITLCTKAIGSGPFSYTWFRGTNVILGATNDCLTLSGVTTMTSDTYCVRITGACGSITNCATVQVLTNTMASALTNLTTCPGGNATFCTSVSGSGLGFMWFHDGMMIAGATNNCFTVTNATAADQGEYCVMVMGSCASFVRCATLTVQTGTSVFGPFNATNCPGENVFLCAKGLGTGPFSYSWFQGTTALPGQTTECLVLSNVTAAAAGTYCVRVAGPCGAVTNCATVTIQTNITAGVLTNTATCPGGTVTFCVPVSGGALSYMWFHNGMMIPGVNSNCLTLTNVTLADRGEYCLMIMGLCDSVLRCAELTVSTNTTAFGPFSTTNCPGENVILCTKGFGTGPFTYAWFRDTTPIPGATADCLTLPNVTAANAGTYCVRVTGPCGSVTNCATVTILTNLLATPLTNITACPGQNVTFCTTPMGSGSFNYLWFRNGIMVNGATNNCLTVNNVTATNAGQYCVIVSGSGVCNTMTNCATLTVVTNVAVTVNSQVVCPGGAALFCATVSGTGPFTYQWFRGTTLLPSQTNDCLSLLDVSLADATNYCVSVTGRCNTATNCGTLTVLPGGSAVGPTNQIVCLGQNVTLCTTTTGPGPFQFRWFRGSNTVLSALIPGATGNCLTITNLTAADATTYCVEISNTCTTIVNCASLILPTPCITISSTCPPTPLVLGQMVTISGTVSNCGSGLLTNVVIMAEGSLVKAPFNLAAGTGTTFTYQFTPTACGNAVGSTVTVTAGDPCTRTQITDSSSTACSVNCPGDLTVTKLIACLLPANVCGPFGKTAIGAKGIQDPAFCYSITISNNGLAVLTNVTVIDNLLGDLTTTFFGGPVGTLAIGQSINRQYSLALATNAVNTVTASGRSATTGQVVTRVDDANAMVLPASIVCQAVVTSPADQDGNTNDSNVTLPSNGAAHPVTFRVTICNNGTVALSNIVVGTTNLGFNCPNLAPFALAPGACTTRIFCTTSLACTNVTRTLNLNVTAGIDTTTGACSFDANGSNIIVRSSCLTTIRCQGEPGLELEKNADRSVVTPGGLVIYTYTVRNSGTVVTNLSLVDDNGTPTFLGDDLVIATNLTLLPGEIRSFTNTLSIPLVICDEADGLPSGVLISEVLGNGDIRATFIQDLSVNDNTYGVNVIGWNGPDKHRFQQLLRSDQATFQFRNGSGQVVLEFMLDYLHEISSAPSGYRSAGVLGGDGGIRSGDASDVVSWTTSLGENLNKPPFLNNLAQYTVDSPALSDPNSAFWEYRMIYSVVVDRTAFGPSGFGGFMITDQHNSPGKREIKEPVPCRTCITNVATVRAFANGQLLTDQDNAVVCVCINSTDPGCSPPTNCPASLTVTKVCQSPTGAGQPIMFQGTVRNSGSTTISNISVVDSLAGLIKTIPFLAPGQSSSFNGSYALAVCGSNVPATVTATGLDLCSGRSIIGSASATCQVPCPGGASLNVQKTIACLLPGNSCGPFGEIAIGAKGQNDPAFCYSITITNNGSVTLTNIMVLDSLFGDLTTNFFGIGVKGGQLTANQSITRMFKMAWSQDTTNVVTAVGRSVATGQSLTSTDSAIALVEPASIVCEATATSPDDLDGVPNDEHVQLPADAATHAVTFKIVVRNSGQIALTNVRIQSPTLAALGCTLPGPFNLGAGRSFTNTLCVRQITCDDDLAADVTVTAQIDTAAGVCGYDFNGTSIIVNSECGISVNCEAGGGRCRVTGGGRQEATFPQVHFVTHGGQVGSPVGDETEFEPDSPCIQGNWQHTRHNKGKDKGNFHAKSFDSLMCACMSCPESPGSGAVIGRLCNPGDRICGPEPRRAPANKICFSGVGDYGTDGKRDPRSVLFRVDIEDRSEPGNSHAGGSTAPHDRHRIRIWILTDAELARLNNPNDRLLDFRRAIACSPGSTALSDGAVGPDRKPVPLGTAVFGVRAPDIDDGGVMNHGNHQIHPGHKPCSEGNRGTSFDVGPLASSFVPVCPKSTDYWKANPSMWVGFTANQDIGTVFDKAGKKTVKHSLVEALGGKGISPSERDLLAQAVTGLLNAGYLGEDYPFAVRDIIAGVNMALANGQSTGIQTLTSLLREANQNTDCQSTSP